MAKIARVTYFNKLSNEKIEVSYSTYNYVISAVAKFY